MSNPIPITKTFKQFILQISSHKIMYFKVETDDFMIGVRRIEFCSWKQSIEEVEKVNSQDISYRTLYITFFFLVKMSPLTHFFKIKFKDV